MRIRNSPKPTQRIEGSKEDPPTEDPIHAFAKLTDQEPSWLHEIILGAVIGFIFIISLHLVQGSIADSAVLSIEGVESDTANPAVASNAEISTGAGVDLGLLAVCQAFQSPALGKLGIRVPQSEEDGYTSLLKYGSFGGRVMISEQKPVGYLMVPKAGSTSLRTIMAKYFGVAWKRGCHCNNRVSFVKSEAPKALRSKSHFIFSFVADPVSQLIGGFYQVNSVGRNVTSFKLYVNAMAEPQKFSWEGQCVVCNEHHRPQIQYFLLNQDRLGPTPLDFIGRLDHAQEDWLELRRRLMEAGISKELPPELMKEREGDALYKKRKEKLRNSLIRHPDVMRRLCFTRFQDYACFGFDFPTQCTDDNGKFNVTEFGPVPWISKWDQEHMQ